MARVKLMLYYSSARFFLSAEQACSCLPSVCGLPRLTVALAVMVLFLGALLGLSGCGGSNSPSATAGTYTVAVTATDVTTGAHSSVNVTLNVQ
jgi:hypothetical protein